MKPRDASGSRTASWEMVSGPTGLGWIGVALTERHAVMLIPPNVVLAGASPDTDSWRLLTWPHDPSLELSLDVDAIAGLAPEVLSTADVLELVGDEMRDWVRRVMRGQFRDALAFASVAAGDFPDEERARASSARLLALHGELSEAFPFEDWYAVPIPDDETIDALISQRPSLVARAASDAARPPWWLDILAAVLAKALRRPRIRRLLGTRLGSRIVHLSKATAVGDEVKRKLSGNCRSEDQSTSDMLAIS